MIQRKFLLCLVQSEDAVGLMSWWSDGDRPQSIVHAASSDDDVVVFEDLDVVLGEERSAVIVTELCQ